MKNIDTEENSDILIDFNKAKTIIYDNLKYLFIVVLVCAIVPILFRLEIHFFGKFNHEKSFIELAQLLCLLLTTFIFAKLAYMKADLRRASILIAAFFFVLFIRENDSILDAVFHGFWAYIAIPLSIIAIIYAFRNFKKGIIELASYLNIPHMKLMIFSVILLIVFSRLFGMRSFWELVMKENFIYDVKAMIEEGIELLAYGLILCSAYLIYKYLMMKTRDL